MLLSPRFAALAQGAYYAITGLWPVVHMPTFIQVTGPKQELWLVRTVGLLLGVIGCSLTSAAIRHRIEPETKFLGIGSALSLASIDAIYWKRGRLPRVFLLDALSEVGLVGIWIAAWRRQPSRDERT